MENEIRKKPYSAAKSNDSFEMIDCCQTSILYYHITDVIADMSSNSSSLCDIDFSKVSNVNGDNLNTHSKCLNSTLGKDGASCIVSEITNRMKNTISLMSKLSFDTDLDLDFLSQYLKFRDAASKYNDDMTPLSERRLNAYLSWIEVLNTPASSKKMISSENDKKVYEITAENGKYNVIISDGKITSIECHDATYYFDDNGNYSHVFNSNTGLEIIDLGDKERYNIINDKTGEHIDVTELMLENISSYTEDNPNYDILMQEAQKVKEIAENKEELTELEFKAVMYMDYKSIKDAYLEAKKDDDTSVMGFQVDILTPRQKEAKQALINIENDLKRIGMMNYSKEDMIKANNQEQDNKDFKYTFNEMTEKEKEEYLKSIDNAINNGVYSTKEAELFYKLTFNISGIEVSLNMVANQEEELQYMKENIEKYYDSFNSLPSKTVKSVVESNQVITVVSDYDCINPDYQYGGYNIRVSNGGNAVFYQDKSTSSNQFSDQFCYAFNHEFGHAYDYSLNCISSEQESQLYDIFSKYNGVTDFMGYSFSNGKRATYYYFYEDTNSTQINDMFIDPKTGNFKKEEAFAEAYRYYTMNPEYMKTYAPKMYEFMDNIISPSPAFPNLSGV